MPDLADPGLWSRYRAFSWLCSAPSATKLPWSQHEAKSFVINEGKIVLGYKGSGWSPLGWDGCFHLILSRYGACAALWKSFPEISASRADRRDTVCKACLQKTLSWPVRRGSRLAGTSWVVSVCVSAVPEPNTKQGTIQTDKIMDEKGVENLSCILVAFLIVIALAALDRKAYPAQRAGKSSPAPTVTLKPVANIQRWGPSQWGAERWLRDPGQPRHSQNRAGSCCCRSEPSDWISRWGFSSKPRHVQG